MVYIRGNQGYVMLSDRQTAYGTKKIPTYTGTIAAGEDLQIVKPQKQVMTDRIRSSSSPTFVQKGKIHTEGTLTFDLIPDEAEGINLAMLFGANNIVAGNSSTGYTHTFSAWSGVTDFPASGITVQKLVGGIDNTMLVDNISCFVNSFELTIPEDGIVTYAVNYMGKTNSFGGTLAVPSYSAKSPFEGWMAHVEVGTTIGSTAAIAIKSATLSIQNNLTLLPDRNASNQYPQAFVPNSRTATMSIELTQEASLTLYNYFLNDTENAVKLVLTHPTLAGSASGVYSLTFNMPRVTWLGEEPKLNSADVLNGSYNFQIMKDSVTGYDIQAILVNSQSGIYTV
jgi:hypothetical protein